MQETRQPSSLLDDGETVALKIPPHSIEAELAVLGGILIDKDVWDSVCERVCEDDFYRKDHRLIFRAIYELSEKGEPYDIVTVAEWLEDNHLLDDAGGMGKLALMVESTPTASNIDAYANIVRKRSILRQLIHATTEINNIIFNPEGRSSEQVLEFAEQTVFEIAEKENRVNKGYKIVKEYLKSAIQRVDDLSNSPNSITGVATGFDDLDMKTAGLQRSDLVIVAGRPSMGKAQPLDAKIRTLTSWKAMGDLKLGDSLASIDGCESKVCGIYPQGEKDIYRIYFSDERSTEVCAEHLWRVYSDIWELQHQVISTEVIKELLNNSRYQNNLWIDKCSGDFGHKEPLPIEPLEFGVLLGHANLKDGLIKESLIDENFFKNLYFLFEQRQLLDVASNGDISFSGYKNNHKSKTVFLALIKEKLTALGLWGNNISIPEIYKNSNKDSRLDLLHGLLSSQSEILYEQNISFTTSNYNFAKDIIETIRSLGGAATKKAQHNSWVIDINYLKSKENSYSNNKKSDIYINQGSFIKKIELVRKAKAQCIAVTHPDKLYITDDYIVTHNTAFAINIAEHAAIKEKLSVAVFSMEMPGEQLVTRMMSSLGRIDQQKVRTGDLNDEDWPRLTSAVEILQETNLYIDDTPSLTPAELRARCRRIVREHGLDLIVVDYLQLMQLPSTRENRATELSEISRSLKAMAKEINVPVIALSQLNRSLEQRQDRRPVMSDLRESGAIEQDADVILFIYRDEVYNEESPDKGIAEIIIGKQRNGPIGKVKLVFRGQYTRFENYIKEREIGFYE